MVATSTRADDGAPRALTSFFFFFFFELLKSVWQN